MQIHSVPKVFARGHQRQPSALVKQRFELGPATTHDAHRSTVDRSGRGPREWGRGTMEGIMVTPVGTSEILLGKLVRCFAMRHGRRHPVHGHGGLPISCSVARIAARAVWHSDAFPAHCPGHGACHQRLHAVSLSPRWWRASLPSCLHSLSLAFSLTFGLCHR
jgi:hypothetical protein